MILLKTKQGIVMCSKHDFRDFVTSKGILRRGEMKVKKGWRRFYSEIHPKPSSFKWHIKNDEVTKNNYDFLIEFNLKWDEVINWYDFDGYLNLNAEKLIELVDKGELKVRE